MSKFWLKLAFVLALATAAFGQGGNTVTTPSATTPSGNCGPNQFWNNSTGSLYRCKGGSWDALGSGGATGTVTNFTAGNFPPLFTTSVATSTTTPALTFVISNAAAFSYYGNATGSSAAPGFTASPQFLAGANLSLLDPSDPTKVVQFGVSNISTGTTRTVNIPDAASTTVQTLASAAHLWVNAMSAQGVLGTSRPACADLSDASATCATAGATRALDNLASVNVNTSLLAQTGVDLGSAAAPFRFVFLWGAGTFGTTSIKLTGTPTAARVWTFPDATDTVVGNSTAATLGSKTLTTPTIADFTNATHNHQNAAGGGTLANAALTNSATTVNGQSCVLGSSCSFGSSALTDASNIPLLNAANVFSSATGQSMKKLLLPGSSSGTLTVLAAAAAGSSTLTLPGGTTDFSATGGANQIVKQSSSGAALTVAALGSGDVPCAAMPALTGDATTSGCAVTFATVNSNVGSFGSATVSPVLTVNAKGLTTAVTTATITPAGTSITGGSTGQVLSGNGGGFIDFPHPFEFIAANCNNATGGNGFSIPSGGTVTCRAGTNNLGGFIAITDTSTTFAQFGLRIPKDWNTGVNPYVSFIVSSTDTTNGHTIIPAIQVSCANIDGSTTDDVTFNAAHSSGTITLNTTASQTWESTMQMNGTDTTGCVAGGWMIVSVQRATDTATGTARFYSVVVTVPRRLVVQAN